MMNKKPAASQTTDRPEMSTAPVSGTIRLDGVLDEADWDRAPINTDFKTVVPEEGGEPSAIVNFSKIRGVDLENEDHIRLVIGPFLDGQSSIILAVNASGARYDALVANRGESENEDWDAIRTREAWASMHGYTGPFIRKETSFSCSITTPSIRWKDGNPAIARFC